MTEDHRSRPWWVLAAVVASQLMVAVDATILALALPGAAAELRLDAAAASWAVSGYVLAAGALMILGGRLSQGVGHARAMTAGLLGFGLFSALGGSVSHGALFILARVGQGASAAVLTPAALARLSLAFPGEDRDRAYGIFGIVMGSGTAIGVLLGGVLTQVGGWRWCMWVNLLFVAVSLAASVRGRDRTRGDHAHLRGGWRGLLLAVGAASVIAALTVGSVFAALLLLLAAGTSLVLFARADRHAAAPLIPPRLFASADRRAAYWGLLLWGLATIGTFVAVSSVMQRDLRLAPLATGLLFLVYPFAVQVGLRLSPPGHGEVRSSILRGLLLISAGVAVFGVTGLTSGDATGLAWLLACLALMGLGTAHVMPVANGAATKAAGPDTGVAAAIGTTFQQIGASIGASLPALIHALHPGLGIRESYGAAAIVGSATLLLGAALLPLLNRDRRLLGAQKGLS